MAKVSVRNLSFLDWRDLNLTVEENEIVSVFGESGSGKSLFLRALADLIPWEGSIKLDDESCLDTEPAMWRKKVAYIPTEILWWSDTVSEHFENGIRREDLDRLGLAEEALSWSPTRLSMGERQRLGLLRALDREPEALLLDEPTANLDSNSTRAVEELVCEYVRDRSACAVWVSHDESQLSRIASHRYRMADKELRADST